MSGVSGVSDHIASGIAFLSDQSVVIHWETEHPSVGFYKNIKHLLLIHGHKLPSGEYATNVVWDDPPPPELVKEVDPQAILQPEKE